MHRKQVVMFGAEWSPQASTIDNWRELVGFQKLFSQSSVTSARQGDEIADQDVHAHVSCIIALPIVEKGYILPELDILPIYEHGLHPAEESDNRCESCKESVFVQANQKH